MDREKLINAILENYRERSGSHQEAILRDALHRISSDTNLIAFAIEIGIDTDALFSKGA